jgi:hypothetical protein
VSSRWTRLGSAAILLGICACRGPSSPRAERTVAIDSGLDRALAPGAMAQIPRIVMALVNAVAHSRTPTDAATLISGRLTQTGSPGWWRVQLPEPGMTVMLSASTPSDAIKEAEISIALSARVRLRDLEEIVGAHETIFESKTSAVRFTAVPARGITVYADLFTSAVRPDSEVTRLTVRRDMP